MATYTITMQDVDAFLETKQDQDEVGITCKGRECLVARAAQMKYPGHEIAIFMGLMLIDRREEYILSNEVHMLYWDFDMLHKGQIERPITKREWLEARGVAL